jgi:hypothetical protein
MTFQDEDAFQGEANAAAGSTADEAPQVGQFLKPCS